MRTFDATKRCLAKILAVAAIAMPLTLGSSLANAQKESRKKIAVLDLKDNGAGKNIANTMTDVVAVALSKLGLFEVMSRADILQMVQFEQDKQMLGCESDVSCLAELGGALGVAMMVSGSLGKVGEKYTINLILTDTRAAEIQSRSSRTDIVADKLTAEVEGAAKFLVRDLLAGETGRLQLLVQDVVNSNRPLVGADVEIDGRVVGTTPFGVTELAGGPHRIKVIKRGFITWAKDVDIEKAEEPLVVVAQMAPSEEYRAELQSKANNWRTWAYITGAVGIAAMGFGGVTYFVVNDKRASDFNNDVEAAGCQQGGAAAGSADCAQFRSRKADIEKLDKAAIAVGWVGVAALGTGLYLFLKGPDPDAYTSGPGEPGVSAGFSPLPGGAMGSATIRF